MKRYIVFFTAIPVAVIFVLAISIAGQQNDTAYLVHEQHTPEQCLRVIDEVATESPELLDAAWWGCGEGVHKSWAILEARNEREVLNKLPEIIHENVTIVEVGQFTAEQIRQWHE